MKMKRILIAVTLMTFQKIAYAGGSPYEWLDFGGSDGRIYGIGEISNQITFFLGENIWISPMPGLVSYREYYIGLIIMITIAGATLQKTGKLNNTSKRTS